MKIRFTMILISLIFAGAAFAHGDKVHVMGVLEKVAADAISVKTAAGKSVEVKLVPATVYVIRDGRSKDGSPAKFSDLAVGQRVVVHATPKGADLIANEVKFAPASSQTKATPQKP
jgi:hypothetical protein